MKNQIQVTGNRGRYSSLDPPSPKLNQKSLLSSHKKHEKNRSLLGRSLRDQDLDEELSKTTNKLYNCNFSHHDPLLCVCESCQCGRHLCSFKNVKPDLSKGSIYRQSFKRKSPIPNIINISKDYDKLQGPHIAMESRHCKEYEGKIGDKNQRRKPEDLLKVGGPSPQLTSYNAGFPGYKGQNQYVKPTDNSIRSEFPMRAKSTYSNAFLNPSSPKPKKQKIEDHLKSMNLWMGKTTYGNYFQQPNPEDYAGKVKKVEKLQLNPNYTRQYQTTYKNSFLKNDITVCSAKKTLETKSKGLFSGKKGKFSENSDFKSLDPSFHAISNSKHYYV